MSTGRWNASPLGKGPKTPELQQRVPLLLLEYFDQVTNFLCALAVRHQQCIRRVDYDQITHTKQGDHLSISVDIIAGAVSDHQIRPGGISVAISREQFVHSVPAP